MTVYILAAKRTAIGSLQGELKDFSATDLGGLVIQAALQQAAVPAADVDEVLMGCVLTAGLGQAPARQAAIKAGLHTHTPAVTVNKVCGSGMRTLMFAADSLTAGHQQVVVAGGMESMSNVPYLLTKARAGYRLGHGKLYDHTFFDGLEDAYRAGTLMGVFADQCARDHNLSRQDQDAFALESLMRVKMAQHSGALQAEMVAIARKDGSLIECDESPLRAKPDKIPTLKPAFGEGGTVTAANASSISDGAAALVLASEAYVHQSNVTPMARLVAQASFAQAPEHFTTAPIGAIEALLKRCQWSLDQVDLFEINEAFAVVTLACTQALKLDPAKVNVNGGACALGHPIGASGARIIVTLVHALKQRGLKRGIAAVCIGGGEATAVAVEMV